MMATPKKPLNSSIHHYIHFGINTISPRTILRKIFKTKSVGIFKTYGINQWGLKVPL